MPRDFEDIFDLDDLSDEELRALVRGELDDQETLDAENILVSVESGIVTLSGRIGTDGERRIADHILSDVIGITEFENNLVVDAIRRDEEPEAIDEHAGMQADTSGAPLGRRPQHQDEEAGHLEEDLDARLYGTLDVQSAIEHGTPWVPPDSPTQEGFSGSDGLSDSRGEDH
ncbi:MAG: BON domain-containing protein [Gemmatimonadaceae bacterium]